jgi:alkylated DNA repair dioxygenase AlkB
MATVKTIDAPMTTYNQATVGATNTVPSVRDGVTGVTPTNYIVKAMSMPALKSYVKERVEQGRQLSIELLAALIEMKSRCKDQGTWHKTLLDCGIKPGTWRQWEFRELNAITTGKRTGDRKNGSGGTRVETTSAKTHRLGDPRLETEAQVVAKAGVQLAKILQDPTLGEAERGAKAADFAGEMITAVEGGDYTVIPVFPDGAKRTRTPEEVAALNWILRLLGAFIADNSKMPQATEARKHATIMRKILEEEILGPPAPSGFDPDPEPPSAAPEPEPAPEPDPTPTTAPVEYIPDFIQHPGEIYEALLSLPWQRHQASFGQPVPRDEVWIAPYPYKYSSRIYPAYDGWTPELLSIKDAVEKHTGVKYDSVLCNLYRTGKDYVPYHCDCEDEMSPAHPIASVSFGAVRVFEMLLKSNRQIREKMKLANGSLLIMKAGMQQEWMHSIRKTRREVGARINLTFRVMTKTEGVA